MAKKIILSLEILNEIINDYLSGISIQKLVKKHNYSRSFINKTLIENNIEIRQAALVNRKYHKIKSDYFSNIDTESKAYILGFLFADGNVSKRDNAITLKLQVKDIDILKKISYEIIQEDAVIKDKYNNAYIKITCAQIKQDLIKLGCIPNKSLKLEFPNLSENMLSHFMRGYFDGDGCLMKHNTDYTWSIISTEKFCLKYKEILTKYCDVNPFLTKRKVSLERGNNITSVLLTGGNLKILRICEWLYKNASWFLSRKHEKFIELKTTIENRKNKKNQIRNEIIELIKSGLSVMQIHKISDRSRWYIYKVLKSLSR